MISKRKIVYSDDLVNIIKIFQVKLCEIEKSLGNETLINQGLFLMITAYFENSIRELMRIVLVAFPEKLTKDSCTISREQICAVADEGYSVIIDNELYFLFKDGVRTQLERLLKILFNKERQAKNKNGRNIITEKEKEAIIKIEEISLYRNALIHNGGKVSAKINETVKYFKPTNKGGDLKFDSNLIRLFIKEYSDFFVYLEDCINNTFSSYQHSSRIERVKKLWKESFSSPMLRFEDYWDVDNERDLITDIKFPDFEDCISNSEKVLLSIWRHQFDDSIKTKEFLLCSIDYHKIYEIYEGLDELKFYHMKQSSKNDYMRKE